MLNTTNLKHIVAPLTDPYVFLWGKIKSAYKRSQMYPILSTAKVFAYRLNITTLDREYQDPDEVLLHAGFQCLVNYVAEVKQTLNIPNYYEPGWYPECCEDVNETAYQKRHMALAALYQWWTLERPNRIDPWAEGAILPDGYTEDTLEEFFYAEDTAKLGELVDLRSALWV